MEQLFESQMKNFSHHKSNLKDKLSKNELTIGSWLTIPNQAIIEILGTAGFEWLTIDMEHSPISIETILNLSCLILLINREIAAKVFYYNKSILKISLSLPSIAFNTSS